MGAFGLSNDELKVLTVADLVANVQQLAVAQKDLAPGAQQRRVAGYIQHTGNLGIGPHNAKNHLAGDDLEALFLPL